MKGFCRAANSCKAGLVVGVLRIACDGLCTAVRFHIAEENPGCLLGVHEGLDCSRHYSRCPTLFESLCSLWPGTGESISPTALFNDVLFTNVVRRNRLCILVAGLLDAFVTALNLRRTNRGPGLNFKELMMTALCPAWARTYQATSLGFDPEQLRPEAFPLPKPKRKFTTLPPRRITSRVTGIESPGWRLFFTDGGFKRKIDGMEMTRWGVAVVSPEKIVRVMCGPVVCAPRVPAFLGAASCLNNTAELTGLAEALRWANFFIPLVAHILFAVSFDG